MFHTYVLIDPLNGVFYVGSGNTKRLKGTLAEPSYPAAHSGFPSQKYRKIQEIQQRGDKVLQEIVFSSEVKIEAEQVEQYLIEAYGACLANNKRPPRYLYR